MCQVSETELLTLAGALLAYRTSQLWLKYRKHFCTYMLLVLRGNIGCGIVGYLAGRAKISITVRCDWTITFRVGGTDTGSNRSFETEGAFFHQNVPVV